MLLGHKKVMHHVAMTICQLHRDHLTLMAKPPQTALQCLQSKSRCIMSAAVRHAESALLWVRARASWQLVGPRLRGQAQPQPAGRWARPACCSRPRPASGHVEVLLLPEVPKARPQAGPRQMAAPALPRLRVSRQLEQIRLHVHRLFHA